MRRSNRQDRLVAYSHAPQQAGRMVRSWPSMDPMASMSASSASGPVAPQAVSTIVRSCLVDQRTSSRSAAEEFSGPANPYAEPALRALVPRETVVSGCDEDRRRRARTEGDGASLRGFRMGIRRPREGGDRGDRPEEERSRDPLRRAWALWQRVDLPAVEPIGPASPRPVRSGLGFPQSPLPLLEVHQLPPCLGEAPDPDHAVRRRTRRGL
jgi:hypothetical protein